MDMMTRSAVLAASLVVVALAAAAGWYFLGDDLLARNDPDPLPDFGDTRQYDDSEGSLYDEFGEGGLAGDPDDRVTIITGLDLEIPPPPSGTVSGLPDGPRFGWQQPQTSGPSSRLSSPEPLPRGTAAERVEADCRGRGGGSYACRCLVRMARSVLEPAEFEFLSLAEEFEPRTDKLTSAGLALTDLPLLSVKLVELDANARRRCGSGLKPGR